MSRVLHPSLLWGHFLEILSFLSINDVYKSCGCLNRAGFIAFLRERATRQCPIHSRSSSRFLSSGLGQQKVLLVSYPRSGNSFLRKLLEHSLGVVTGSDSRPNRTLAESLLRCGFKGEGIIDDSVWVVKTHYPERMGYLKFKARRIVLLVRNPFDAIESYFHMGMTNTHDKHLSVEAFRLIAHVWLPFVLNEIKVWQRFHHYWMKAAESLCVLPVRYEDLLSDREETLKKVTAFMMEQKPPLGIHRYLPRSTAPSKSTGYKPKGGGVGKGLRLLDVHQIRGIVSEIGYLLDLFGYTINSEDDWNQLNCNEDLKGPHEGSGDVKRNVDDDQDGLKGYKTCDTKTNEEKGLIGSCDQRHDGNEVLSSFSSYSTYLPTPPSSSSSSSSPSSPSSSSSSSSCVRTSAHTIEVSPLPYQTPAEWKAAFRGVKYRSAGDMNAHSGSSGSSDNSGSSGSSGSSSNDSDNSNSNSGNRSTNGTSNSTCTSNGTSGTSDTSSSSSISSRSNGNNSSGSTHNNKSSNNNIYSDDSYPPLDPVISYDTSHPSHPSSTKPSHISNPSPSNPFLSINEVFSVRLAGDIYGRGITELRRKYTVDDRKPFETMQ